MPHAQARILIVDGQVTVARLVAKIFGVAGLPNAHIAFDTPTGREQMEARAPDILIVDARIAPMNVTAFITLARKLTNGQTVTLMMTTSKTAEVVDAAREAGVDGILVKPFTPSDLRSELTLAKERKMSSPVRNRE
jgi:two-component system chemotaxis response regulator CheY